MCFLVNFWKSLRMSFFTEYLWTAVSFCVKLEHYQAVFLMRHRLLQIYSCLLSLLGLIEYTRSSYLIRWQNIWKYLQVDFTCLFANKINKTWCNKVNEQITLTPHTYDNSTSDKNLAPAGTYMCDRILRKLVPIFN